MKLFFILKRSSFFSEGDMCALTCTHFLVPNGLVQNNQTESPQNLHYINGKRILKYGPHCFYYGQFRSNKGPKRGHYIDIRDIYINILYFGKTLSICDMFKNKCKRRCIETVLVCTWYDLINT